MSTNDVVKKTEERRSVMESLGVVIDDDGPACDCCGFGIPLDAMYTVEPGLGPFHESCAGTFDVNSVVRPPGDGVRLLLDCNKDVEINALREKVEQLRVVAAGQEKKNHKGSVPVVGRKYVLLEKELNAWGKVPAQQQALAEAIVVRHEVGQEVSEADLQETVYAAAAVDARLKGSKQDPWYLFRYYRGLKNDGKYAGFVARGFLQQKG